MIRAKRNMISKAVVMLIVADLVTVYNDLEKANTADYRANHIRGHILETLTGFYRAFKEQGETNADREVQMHIRQQLTLLNPAYVKQHITAQESMRSELVTDELP